MKIIIRKPTGAEKKEASTWEIWEKEASEFPWEYDDQEICYFLKGKVIVTAKNEKVSFGKGDYVIFPKGLKCVWKIIEPVKKHYRFG